MSKPRDPSQLVLTAELMRRKMAVTTDVQTWEEMSYADGVLASGFSSNINTPAS